jgi:cell division septation protein DedD
MMKRPVILFLATAALLAGGCDFVRTIAGRPTSDEMEVMRSNFERAQNAARYLARIDSLEQVRGHLADSMVVPDEPLPDTLPQPQETIPESTEMESRPATGRAARYCIIVGAYQNRAYAERKLARCKEAGYTDASIISFKGGFNAVAICPSDNLEETEKKLRQVRGKGICPLDGWIFRNE